MNYETFDIIMNKSKQNIHIMYYIKRKRVIEVFLIKPDRF